MWRWPSGKPRSLNRKDTYTVQQEKRWWVLQSFQCRTLLRNKTSTVTWCKDSGLRLQKSHTMSGSFMWVWGLRFWEWTNDGNCMGSRAQVSAFHVRFRVKGWKPPLITFIAVKITALINHMWNYSAPHISDTHSPARRPWWRKWGCCCPSGPSCPHQCKTSVQSLWGLAPCLRIQTLQLE